MKIVSDKIKAFTLIEVLLYIALVTIVSGMLFSYGWNIMDAKIKAKTVRETGESAQYISEKLMREIRGAHSVDKDNSKFDQTEGKLVLNSEGGVVIFETDNGRLYLKRGDDEAYWLNPGNVSIENLVFYGEKSIDDKIVYVGFSFIAKANYPQVGDNFRYNYSININSGAEIRAW